MTTADTVLIVENNATVALDLLASLNKAGYRVVGLAKDVSSALDLADRHKPTIAIVDLELSTPTDGVMIGQALTTRYAIQVVYVTRRTRVLIKDLLNVGNVVPAPAVARAILKAIK